MNKSSNGYPALNAYIEAMCTIPSGTFRMGSAKGDADERPVHNVMLTPFRMGQTPVTVTIWKEYCTATGTTMPTAPGWGLLDNHPIVNVSWNDIMGVDGNGGFCAWASDIAGFRLTLPTEAQFEYAARGGKDGLEFPWANTFNRTRVWSGGKNVSDNRTTAPVNRTCDIYENAYGLTDMSGNVFQWCADWYGAYSKSTTTNPIGERTNDGYRCVRGGSWDADYPEGFRCANRYGFSPHDWGVYIGFRLAAGAPM
jgi:formylglycine-generating enzyme required for sulfatase activity